jgi:hypothetical protein
VELFARVEVENLHVPSLPVKRFVIEYHELVGLATLGKYFALRLDVVQTCDDAVVHLDAEVIVLENEDAWLRGGVNRLALPLTAARGDVRNSATLMNDVTFDASRCCQRLW